MKYKLYAQRIFCFHWNECFSFYKDTIGLPVKFESEEMGWAEFDVGGVLAHFKDPDGNTITLLGGGVNVGGLNS